MARDLKPAEDRDRYGHYSPPREEVRPDDGRRGGFAWLYGDSIGMAPDELIESAMNKLVERENKIQALLDRVERKHEDKIKALGEPLREIQGELHAAQILIADLRRPLARVEYPEKAYGTPR